MSRPRPARGEKQNRVDVYLASPNSQLQADHAAGMNVLMSFAVHSPWHDRWLPSFASVLGDCGAYTFLQGGKEPDVAAYKAWGELRRKSFVACAGVDDIRGDWRKSWRNYQAIPWGFPTSKTPRTRQSS